MTQLIKFSHVYAKMPKNHSPSCLLDAITVELADLSPEFLQYDTAILGGGNYPLPKEGEYLMLMLLTESGQLWTTLRSRTLEKEAYYKRCIGKMFSICIEQDERRITGRAEVPEANAEEIRKRNERRKSWHSQ